VIYIQGNFSLWGHLPPRTLLAVTTGSWVLCRELRLLPSNNAYDRNFLPYHIPPLPSTIQRLLGPNVSTAKVKEHWLLELVTIQSLLLQGPYSTDIL
jgi:hypothetical protein